MLLRPVTTIATLAVLIAAAPAFAADSAVETAIHRRVDDIALAVFERIGATPAQCPEAYADGPGWKGPSMILCGRVDVAPGELRRRRKEILDLVLESGLALDTVVEGGTSWTTPARQSFDARSLLLEFVPVQLVVHPASRLVSIAYPIGEEPDVPIQPLEPAEDLASVVSPKPLRILGPEYPELARQARLSGHVALKATLERSGRFGEIEVFRVDKPNLGFEEAAVRAVKNWLYVPATRDGEPVDLVIRLEVDFTLR